MVSAEFENDPTHEMCSILHIIRCIWSVNVQLDILKYGHTAQLVCDIVDVLTSN